MGGCLWGVGKQVEGEEEGDCKQKAQKDQGPAQARKGPDQVGGGHPETEIGPTG